MNPSSLPEPIGLRVPRLEDAPLLDGAGTFAADWWFPGQLHMRVVRSELARGCLRGIDTEAAVAHDGVIAVWTAADISELPAIGFRKTRYRGLEPFRQPVLATERVRYVGEPVAVVFAETAYVAEDAAALVVVDVEEWPPLLDADDEPGDFDGAHSTEASVVEKGFGNVEAAFRKAHDVVEIDVSIGRHTGVPLECRGGVARVNPETGVLELYGATKRAHPNRDEIANAFGLEKDRVQLIEGQIGGGFGVRGELYPEDFLLCAAALRLMRPVGWIEDRREHLIAINHSRQQRHQVRAAIDPEGRILAIDGRFFHDQGAYLRTHGVRVPDMTAGLLLGPYHVPAYRVSGHVRLTNKTPAATYRSPGRFEGTFVRERLLDAIAARTELSPVAVRRRNFVNASAMPYERNLDALEVDVILDSGDYESLLGKAIDAFDWATTRKTVAERRARGETAGAGLACFVEKSGLGPTDKAVVSIGGDGKVQVVTGAADLGQGVKTVMAQICAAYLGMDLETISVVSGRTDLIDEGYGSHASRTTTLTGGAVREAAENLKNIMIFKGAALLQAEVRDLVAGDGMVRHRTTGASLTYTEIARHECDTGLRAEGRCDISHMNYPYGLHMAVVAIDTATGLVDVERFCIAYDVGRAVNPMLVEGQLAGGLAQGIGGTLFEEFSYDASGQPLSSTFADYVLPGATDIPAAELLLSEDAPSPLNPLGVKGAGEGGINAVGAAIASAIDDALQCPGAVTELPVTPRRMMALLSRAGIRT